MPLHDDIIHQQQHNTTIRPHTWPAFFSVIKRNQFARSLSIARNQAQLNVRELPHSRNTRVVLLSRSACIAACCFCVTAGQDATSNAVALEVAPLRRLCLAFPHPSAAAHGLLSLLFRLLRAFPLNAIKRNLNRSSPASTKASRGAILARRRVWGRWVADLPRGIQFSDRRKASLC